MAVGRQCHAPTPLFLRKELQDGQLKGSKSRSGRESKERNPCACQESMLCALACNQSLYRLSFSTGTAHNYDSKRI